ncbi:E3 ubiquitin-protein ligase RGLG5-like [Tasmannia lanceolata]|uniref:E3 ubiquitin-protein ligase RGLG5-like n=1 Tax=Tasmannia lanceolata TaxID=3420 RepID=UPI004064A4BD
MGSGSSKGRSYSYGSGSRSSAWNDYTDPPPAPSSSQEYVTPSQTYNPPQPPQPQYFASSQEYVTPSQTYNPPQPPQPQYYDAQTRNYASQNSTGRYSRIADNYNSLEQVTGALAHAGLESSNLIVGIDFTKSNEWTGKRSFAGKSLHHIGDRQNPYEQAISIIGGTLSAFDEDNLIPCFGFGDASTHDQDVFSFYPDDQLCNGFEEALARYREIVPHLRLAGPTSFAPVIEMAITIVEQSGGQYHVLLIIADGQVTRSVDTARGQLSPQEQKTIDAIVRASEYPLSIILVGVGDGPWDMMREFDDNIPDRAFDNFQFVNFSEIMSKNVPLPKKETEFALAALMEIPSQYKATLELGILGRQTGKSPNRFSLPPPRGNYGVPSFNSKSSQYSSTSQHSGFQKHTPPYRGANSSVSSASSFSYPSAGTAPPASAAWDNQVCPICLTNPKDMAFGCGHLTCCECGQNLQLCPICRSEIKTRIKLY